MKKLNRYIVLTALIALFASCQSSKQVLSKSDSRVKIMNNIANDQEMSKEMVDAIMREDHGKMLMQEKMKTMMADKSMMKKMMKDDPEMKKRMMSGMMETAKSDTSMMAEMCKSMMGNPEMMQMMQKMEGKNKGTNMKQMNKN